jgi:hypothetical protein
MKKFALSLILAMTATAQCFAVAPNQTTKTPACKEGEYLARSVFIFTSKDIFGDANPNTLARVYGASDKGGVAESWEYLHRVLEAENPSLHNFTVVSTSKLE